jgi:hypothetical protein
MRAITIRNIPPEVERVIKKRAQKEGSLNRAVIKLLEESVGMGAKNGKARRYHDLDHLFGSWTKAQADEFDRALAEQRKIHPDDWKE